MHWFKFLSILLLAFVAFVAWAGCENWELPPVDHPELVLPWDLDGDGVPELPEGGRGAPHVRYDNCPGIPNEQFDGDSDGIGDACDDDLDNDGVPNDNDVCPFGPEDTHNGCDLDGDGDGDGVPNGQDNCPLQKNEAQCDLDNDGIGYMCDPDPEGDGVLNDPLDYISLPLDCLTPSGL